MSENNLLHPPLARNTEERHKIYSKKAVMGFSLFFTSIFGGVLLMQNLREAGKKKEARTVLLLSTFYTVLCIYIVNIPEEPNTSLTYVCNIVGGIILTEVFYKKHFADEKSYEKKRIWKPLIISLLITIPFVLAMISQI